MPSSPNRALRGPGRRSPALPNPRYRRLPPPGRNGVVPTVPIPRPPYNPICPAAAGVVDPTFGARVTRISDRGTFDTLFGGTVYSGGNTQTVAYRHLYSVVQPWNADGSLLALQCPDGSNTNNPIWILDGRSYRALYCITTFNGNNSFRWSNTDPDTAYMPAASGSSTRMDIIHPKRLASLGLAANLQANVPTTPLADFTEFTGGHVTFGADKGNFSLDDRYVAVTGTRSSDGAVGITVWDQLAAARVNAVPYWFYGYSAGGVSGQGTPGSGPVSNPPYNDFNQMVSVSPLGSSVIIQNPKVGTGSGSGVQGIQVVAGGSGYTDGAAITFSGGGPGAVQATGTIKVTAGAITAIVINSPGQYTQIPQISIPGGSGATVCIGMQSSWWFSRQGFPGPAYQSAAGAALASGSAAFLCSSLSHSDLALDAARNEVFLGAEIGQASGISTNLSNLNLPASTALWPLSAAGVGPGSMLESYDWQNNLQDHISGRATDRPGWAVISDQKAADWTGPNGYPAYGWGSIYFLDLLTGIPYPLCSTHTSYNFDSSGRSYYQPHAVPNRDGTKVLFASDWLQGQPAGTGSFDAAGNGAIHAYVAEWTR